MEKKKFFVSLFVTIFIIGGYFAYSLYQKKDTIEFTTDEQVSDFEDKIPVQCENGEWTEFPAYAKEGKLPEFSENVTIKTTLDDKFTNEDGSTYFITDENYSLTFFSGRKVQIKGKEVTENNQKEVYVDRIKCSGPEADKTVQTQRQNLMNYISKNIDSIAPEKAVGSQWQVQTFFFYNSTDLYVEYESLGSLGGDSAYDGRMWLIRVSEIDKDAPKIETLAYIQEDEEDPAKNVVKTGQDLYADADELTIYEFDEDAGKWILQ